MTAAKEPVTLSEEELQDTKDRVWKAWFDRLLSSVKGPKIFHPSPDDIAAAIAGFRPAGFLKYNLSQMTAGEWTATVTEPLLDRKRKDHGYCPLWLSFIGLFYLGCSGLLEAYRQRALLRLNGKENDPRHFEDEIARIMVEVGSPAPTNPASLNLVITRTVATPMPFLTWAPSNWLPSPLYPVLLAPAAQINGFLDALGPAWPPLQQIDTVMFELAPEQMTLTRLYPAELVAPDLSQLRILLSNVRISYLVPQVTDSPRPGFIVAPKTIEEAMARARDSRPRATS